MANSEFDNRNNPERKLDWTRLSAEGPGHGWMMPDFAKASFDIGQGYRLPEEYQPLVNDLFANPNVAKYNKVNELVAQYIHKDFSTGVKFDQRVFFEARAGTDLVDIYSLTIHRSNHELNVLMGLYLTNIATVPPPKLDRVNIRDLAGDNIRMKIEGSKIALASGIFADVDRTAFFQAQKSISLSAEMFDERVLFFSRGTALLRELSDASLNHLDRPVIGKLGRLFTPELEEDNYQLPIFLRAAKKYPESLVVALRDIPSSYNDLPQWFAWRKFMPGGPYLQEILRSNIPIQITIDKGTPSAYTVEIKYDKSSNEIALTNLGPAHSFLCFSTNRSKNWYNSLIQGK